MMNCVTHIESASFCTIVRYLHCPVLTLSGRLFINISSIIDENPTDELGSY